jgi:hypothetical protein
MMRGGRATLIGFTGLTFRAAVIGATDSVPFSEVGAGPSIAGGRVFQRTFGFKVGESGIFLIGASGIRGGGALARRSAGFGAATGAFLRIGSGFIRGVVGAALLD